MPNVVAPCTNGPAYSTSNEKRQFYKIGTRWLCWYPRRMTNLTNFFSPIKCLCSFPLGCDFIQIFFSLSHPLLMQESQSVGPGRDQCQKIIDVCILRMFVISQSVYPCQTFSAQSNICGSGSEGASLGQAPFLLANIRRGWKGLQRTNPLAYHEHL